MFLAEIDRPVARTGTPSRSPPVERLIAVERRTPVERAHIVNVERLIEESAEMLPLEGPISAFVFLNTLHAFEDMPFHEGVKKASKLFGCEPYLSEQRYREELKRERIRFVDLRGRSTMTSGQPGARSWRGSAPGRISAMPCCNAPFSSGRTRN